MGAERDEGRGGRMGGKRKERAVRRRRGRLEKGGASGEGAGATRGYARSTNSNKVAGQVSIRGAGTCSSTATDFGECPSNLLCLPRAPAGALCAPQLAHVPRVLSPPPPRPWPSTLLPRSRLGRQPGRVRQFRWTRCQKKGYRLQALPRKRDLPATPRERGGKRALGGMVISVPPPRRHSRGAGNPGAGLSMPGVRDQGEAVGAHVWPRAAVGAFIDLCGGA